MAQYREFINPYHFAPLGGPVKRDKKEELSEVKGRRYTGKLQVALKTRTPLFIPDTHGRRNEEAKHKTYEFFSYDGVNPAIPGSSLNGMLRNVFETVTNSCLSAVDMEEKPVRRTNEYYSPGLLHRDQQGNMVLYRAKKATVKPDQRPDRTSDNKPVRTKEFQEGTEVKAKIRQAGRETLAENVRLPGEVAGKGAHLWTTGYYFKGEPGVKKQNTKDKSCNAYVFYFPDGNKETEKDGLSEKSLEIRQLRDVLKSYGDFASKKSALRDHQGYKEYVKRFEDFLAYGIGYFPVHYSNAAGHLYLSPACITKEVYYTSVKDILKKQEEHHTCDNIHSLCPGCRLFGMVGNGVSKERDYPNSWAGSVRVQDAFLKEKENPGKIYMDKITLMELAGPRKSSTEFYLQKPEGKAGEEVLSWTYDYYMAKKNGKFAAAAYTPRISGRKFYWHHLRPNLPKEFVEVTDRNCTVTPIRSGVEFTFPVYFEKISEKQLKQLIWLCNISSQAEKGRPKYGYKLGRGKPLGLGSVELTVEAVQIRCLKKDGEICYHLESFEEVFGKDYQSVDYESVGFEPEIKDAFLRLCEFEAVGKMPVTYPVENRQSVVLAYNGYKWFGNNHFHIDGGNGRITKRNELVFQQYMKPLTGSSSIKLEVNTGTRDAHNLPYDPKIKANNNFPAVGSKVWAVIQKMDNMNIYVKAETKTVPAFDIKVEKKRGTEYKAGSRIYVELTKIFFRQGSASYEGKDASNRKRPQ